MGAKGTVGLGIALLLVAASFDASALYLPGIALVLLALGARASVSLARRSLVLERERGAPTVVEGEPYAVHFLIRHGWAPLRAELRDPLLAEPLAIRTGFGAGERLLRSETRFERRGRRRLGPARLAIADPLGLEVREIESGDESEVLVLPRVEPVVAAAAGAEPGGEAAGGSGTGPRGGPMPDVEVDGIRPYRQGSPASRIHWPLFARHGELVERHLVAGSEGAPLVVLDAARPEDGEALDRAVRAAASLCVVLARQGGCVLVAGQGGPLAIDPQLRGWPRAHVRLALVIEGEAAPASVRQARGITVFWVTGAAAAAVPAPAADRFVVTPHPPASARPAFTVAGCAGIRVSARTRRVAA
jgi:uncharacterized protein (DUF58 family)